MKICVTHPHAPCDLDSSYHRVHLEELEGIEDSSCKEVHLIDTADFIPSVQRKDLYELAIKKLRHGGSLSISGRDLYDLAKNITYDELTLEEANKLIFSMRMSMDHLQGVRDILKTIGLKIETAYYDGPYVYFIKGIRE